MHYDARLGHEGLELDPFKSIMAPRPIGWISTISSAGVLNLAPYSFFNAVGEDPHYVMFSSTGVKDSLTNVEETGEFVCSLATWDLVQSINMSSAAVPPEIDEFQIAGLTPAPSKFVKPPRVKESPAAFECRHHLTVPLPPGRDGRGNHVVIGEVIGVYIDEAYIRDGRVKTSDLLPVARLGGRDYAVIRPEVVFPLGRPVVDENGNVSIKK